MSPRIQWLVIVAVLVVLGFTYPMLLASSWWPRSWSKDDVRRICREEVRQPHASD